MNPFLFWGLVGGGICIIVHLTLTLSAKKAPELGHALELMILSVGASGGVKICIYVFDGKLGSALKSAGTSISEEDLVYFVIGALALFWLSVEAILRRLSGAYEAYRKANPHQ